MSGLPQWIAVMAAITAFFLFQAGFWWFRGRQRRREQQVRQRLLGQQEPRGEGVIRIRAKGEARAQGWLARLGSLRQLDDLLLEGGIEIPAGQFVAIAGLVAGITLVVTTLLTGSGVGGVAVALLVLLALRLYLTQRRDRRLQAVDAALPRALEVMVFSLRAGQSLEESIRAAGQEAAPPLGQELRRCHEEYKLGRPIENALVQLRARWPSLRALYSLVEAVAVLKRSGGNLVEVMEKLIETLRAQSAHEARHRALTSEGRLSALILMLLPLLSLAFQLLTAPRALTGMLQQGSGRTLLGLAVLLWAFGSLWVARLSRVSRTGV